jgi:hypothetical protein
MSAAYNNREPPRPVTLYDSGAVVELPDDGEEPRD